MGNVFFTVKSPDLRSDGISFMVGNHFSYTPEIPLCAHVTSDWFVNDHYDSPLSEGCSKLLTPRIFPVSSAGTLLGRVPCEREGWWGVSTDG